MAVVVQMFRFQRFLGYKSDKMSEKAPSNHKKYSCPICSKSFEWKSGLSRHKKQSHAQNKRIFSKKSVTIPPKPNNKISKIYGNVVSETVYSSDSDCEYEILQTIVKVHEKGDKKCDVCGKTFVKQRSLNRHSNRHKTKDIQTVEVRNLTHDCDKCGKSFKSACNLSNHLKLHLKESFVTKKIGSTVQNSYPCNLCSRVYLKQSHLQNHLLLHDSVKKSLQDKLYLCMICGKRYTRSSHLSLHMRTHVDFRPHLCSICGNFFKKKKQKFV